MIVTFIAIDLSSFPADFIDSSSAVHHHFLITCSAWMKDLLVITGLLRTLRDSSNELKPLPTIISPHTADKLLVQNTFPVSPVALVEVLKVSSCP